MQQIFEEADTDKSGKLDQEELKASMSGLAADFRQWKRLPGGNGRVRDRLRLLRLPFKAFRWILGMRSLSDLLPGLRDAVRHPGR